ncbi:hypothetical protein BCIN_15g02810 [Botrytis cinerea B05.10]|uniref:Uncharacterized protein n=2 Tax=Botryotinia fuckeliana TaxID=40559 RepID=A0A384K4I4_BOTFB|nr:hypothetical protein BCIN_15g02810 [Botrytis cinerea B05.10]ATZ57739.1 hypothetical protein BCIN_15g02810 [Botrytis cinerea B05.10]CCD47279.1 hypothetical protein BofuT4_P004380.1 [Botrytis cinerea T4]
MISSVALLQNSPLSHPRQNPSPHIHLTLRSIHSRFPASHNLLHVDISPDSPFPRRNQHAAVAKRGTRNEAETVIPVTSCPFEASRWSALVIPVLLSPRRLTEFAAPSPSHCTLVACI